MSVGELLVGVWSIPVLLLAALAGGLFGFAAIGYAIRNPLFSSGLATPAQNGLLAMFMAIAGGGAFWLSQILGAYLAGDPLWWRVASRFTVWLVFCLALGAGAYLAARSHRQQRARAARTRIRKELDR
ncbi:MAG TPA: hypothetical protein VFI34_07575 [Candidatus Limnocylindrales bacterium]|nr:hypothetical protein [Candidatus Limnocylindrales bacterium]